MNMISKSLFEKVCFNTDINNGCDIDGDSIFNSDEERVRYTPDNIRESELSLKFLMLKYGAPKLALQIGDIYYMGPVIQTDTVESFAQPVKPIHLPSENPVEGYVEGLSNLKKIMDGTLTSFVIEPTIGTAKYARKTGRAFKNNLQAELDTENNPFIAFLNASFQTGRETGGEVIESIKQIPEALLALGINLLTISEKPPFEQGRILGQAAHFIAPTLAVCKLAKATRFGINAFLDDRFNFKRMGAPISKEEIRRLNRAHSEAKKTKTKPEADKPELNPKTEKPVDIDVHARIQGRRNKLRATKELAHLEPKHNVLVQEILRKKIFSTAEKEAILTNLGNLGKSPHPMAEIISLDAYNTFRTLAGGRDLAPMRIVISTIAKERGIRPIEVTTLLYKDMLELKLYLSKARINRLRLQSSLPESTDFNLFLSIEEDCLVMLHDIDIHLKNFSPRSTAAARWTRQ